LLEGEGQKMSAPEAEEVEDLARQLMTQIKKSDFLEQNPAKGESIFSLVGSEGGEEAAAVEPGDGSRAAVSDNSCAGAESVEDLTRQLLMQLRSAPTVTVPQGGRDAAAQFLGVGAQGGGGAGAGGLEDMLQGLVDVTSVDQCKLGDSSGADKKLPGLGDALETLLGALGPDGGQGGGILEVSNDEDDEILAAFKAMRPTVDQALKELKDV